VGEQQCSLGYVVPTITILKKKLMKADVKHAVPLRDCLLSGIEDRFGRLWNDREFLLVAVTHLKFKIAWTDYWQLCVHCSQLLEQAVLFCVATTPFTGDGTTSSRSSSHRQQLVLRYLLKIWSI